MLGAELYQGHQLIKNGPFAVMRHPMYVGVLLAAIGALLIFRTWAMLIFVPMSLVVVGRANHEEKLLADKPEHIIERAETVGSLAETALFFPGYF